MKKKLFFVSKMNSVLPLLKAGVIWSDPNGRVILLKIPYMGEYFNAFKIDDEIWTAPAQEYYISVDNTKLASLGVQVGDKTYVRFYDFQTFPIEVETLTRRGKPVIKKAVGTATFLCDEIWSAENISESKTLFKVEDKYYLFYDDYIEPGKFGECSLSAEQIERLSTDWTTIGFSEINFSGC